MCVAIISQRFDLHHTLISKFCVVMFVMTFAISAVVMFMGFFRFWCWWCPFCCHHYVRVRSCEVWEGTSKFINRAWFFFCFLFFVLMFFVIFAMMTFGIFVREDVIVYLYIMTSLYLHIRCGSCRSNVNSPKWRQYVSILGNFRSNNNDAWSWERGWFWKHGRIWCCRIHSQRHRSSRWT